MNFEKLKDDLDDLSAIIRLSLSAKSIVELMNDDKTTGVAENLFNNFNNGRLDTLLKGFIDEIKEKLIIISNRYNIEDIEIFKSELLNSINRKLLEIENKTDAADTENIIYQSVIHKLKDKETIFTKAEMLTYVSADLHFKLRSVAAEIIYEVNNLKTLIETNPKEIRNIELLTAELKKFGFFDLEMVKKVKDCSNLVELLNNNQAPYIIAMFDYLGFISKIYKDFTKNEKGKRDKIISQIIGYSFDTVKKNVLTLNILNDHTDSFKAKATAWKHKLTVINDYKKLI